jgi:hypothetical protein
MPSYPSSIHLSGISKDEYFQNIQQALSAEKSTVRKQDAISWLAFNFSNGTIRVPGRIMDWCKYGSIPFIGLFLRASSHYFPRLMHRVETSYTLKNKLEPDKAILNELLFQKKTNLYSLQLSNNDN